MITDLTEFFGMGICVIIGIIIGVLYEKEKNET